MVKYIQNEGGSIAGKVIFQVNISRTEKAGIKLP